MSAAPMDDLQLKAVEQRRELHRTVSEFRHKVHDAREKLRFQKQAHDHLALVSGLAALASLAAGYGFAGLFTRH